MFFLFLFFDGVNNNGQFELVMITDWFVHC